MPRQRLQLSEETEKTILEMIKEGCSFHEIESSLGISNFAITKTKRKYGLLQPNPNPRRSLGQNLIYEVEALE